MAIRYAILIVESKPSLLGFYLEPTTDILGVRDEIIDAEDYRSFIIKENNLNPNNVHVVQYQE